MPWWFDLVLLGAGLVLWFSGFEERDDVWGLFQKLLGVAALLVVLLGGRLLVLELAGLALALWLPSASSRRLLSLRYRSDPIEDGEKSEGPAAR